MDVVTALQQIVKHLPGQHDQASHGRGGGSGERNLTDAEKRPMRQQSAAKRSVPMRYRSQLRGEEAAAASVGNTVHPSKIAQEGTAKLSEYKVNAQGTHLTWSEPKEMSGHVVLETTDDRVTHANTVELENHLRKVLPGSGAYESLRKPGDISGIFVSNINVGKGYITANVRITPSKSMQRDWNTFEEAYGGD